jgi:hypothetical protein
MLSRIRLSNPKSLTKHPFADAANAGPAVCEVTQLYPEAFPSRSSAAREKDYICPRNANLGRACGVSRLHTAIRFTRINVAGQNNAG